MMMENPSIKQGIYYGGFSIVFTLLLYFIDKALIFNPFIPAVVLFIASIYFMVKAANEERDLDADGLLTYGDAVRVTFIVVLVGVIIFAVFNYILFNFIDPGLLEIMQQEATAMVENFLSIAGEEEAIEEARAEINKQDFKYSFGFVIADVVGSLIFGIIKALIVAIFVKRTT